MHLPHTVRVAAFTLGLASLAACSGTAAPDQVAPSGPAGASVAVAVEPTAPSVGASGTVTFAATVTGAVNTSVRWTVREVGGGTVDTTGRYVAPGAAGVFHVEAVSVADPTKSAAATVTVTAPPPPVVVTVTPTPASVDACQALTLTATVTGTANTAVTWSVLEGVNGGAVTPAGVYTAPSTGGTYHLVATSVADPSRSATATVTVVERVVSVQVNPPSASLQTGGTAQFTATVTTTCGTFAAAAPAALTARAAAN